MGAGANMNMSKPLKILIEFRKYEKELYKYLFGFPDIKEDMTFYFISKNYIKYFLLLFNFSNFSKELDELILYLESPDDNYNNISKTRNTLLRSLNNKIDSSLTMEKINNKKMLEKFESEKIFFMKINQEGSFVPLTKNIWELFSDYYGYDVILIKKGFINEGEIFILTEEEKKIDCFFIYFHTKDLIYHYSFVMDNLIDFNTLITHFKNKGPNFSARYLIGISEIDIKNTKNFQKFKKKIPESLNFDVTIYFVDSFYFNNSDGKNFDDFEIKDNGSFLKYKKQNINIIESINKKNKKS